MGPQIESELPRALCVGLVQAKSDSQSMLQLTMAQAGFNCEVIPMFDFQPVRLRGVSLDVTLVHFEQVDSFSVRTLRHFRLVFPEAKLVVLSAEIDPEIVFACFAEGAAGFLKVPGSSLGIEEAVRQVFGGGFAFCQEAQRALLLRLQSAVLRCGEGDLSGREREVLGFFAQGFQEKEVAAKLNISAGTAHLHMAKIRRKLGVHSARQAVRKYFYG